MIRNGLYGFILLFFVAFSQMSCYEDVPTLSSQDRKVVDSLYNAERKLQLKLLDSICDANFEQRLGAAVDSIMMKRLEEMQRLKGEGF